MNYIRKIANRREKTGLMNGADQVCFDSGWTWEERGGLEGVVDLEKEDKGLIKKE